MRDHWSRDVHISEYDWFIEGPVGEYAEDATLFASRKTRVKSSMSSMSMIYAEILLDPE